MFKPFFKVIPSTQYLLTYSWALQPFAGLFLTDDPPPYCPILGCRFHILDSGGFQVSFEPQQRFFVQLCQTPCLTSIHGDWKSLESFFRNLEHRRQIFPRPGISLILAYVDDIDVIGDSFDAVRGIFLQFQQDAKKIGLNINEDKTKYLHLTQYSSVRLPTKINKGSSIFERPLEFKYIGALITDDNEMRKEIHMRICNAWKNTHSLYSLLRFKLLSIALKIQLYHSVIQPIVIYGCETGNLSKMDEESRLRFERKILRIIFGPTQDMATNEYRNRSNLELRDLYQSPNIVQLIKSRRLRWAEQVIRSDHSRIIKSVWEKSPDGKRPRKRPRMR